MNDVVQDEVVDTQQNSEEVADVKVKKAFPISKRTKNDQSRTSVLYTVATVVLYVLAYLPSSLYRSFSASSATILCRTTLSGRSSA